MSKHLNKYEQYDYSLAMRESEYAYLDEWQETDRLVKEILGEDIVKELEDEMRIVNGIPAKENGKKLNKKRVQEIVDFVESGARYGQVEYYRCKHSNSEQVAYQKTVEKLKAEGRINVDIAVRKRGDILYLERI